MELVTVEDIKGIFPRPLEHGEEQRAQALIDAALDLIEEAFLRNGRDFAEDVENSRLLQLTVKRIIREMVSEAIHVGDNVGMASASSTTAIQSDSVTWSAGVGIHWGGVHLSDRWLKELGLLMGSMVGYNFPPARDYPEPSRGRVNGAEFSNRGRSC